MLNPLVGNLISRASISPKEKSLIFKWAIPGILFFILSFQYSVLYKSLPMTGVKPRTSGVGNNRFTNWATTTAPWVISLFSVTIFFNSQLKWLKWLLSVWLWKWVSYDRSEKWWDAEWEREKECTSQKERETERERDVFWLRERDNVRVRESIEARERYIYFVL